jgi:hypothetical protein
VTKDEHRERHLLLHAALDELMADFLTQNRPKLPSNTTVMELMVWSHAQTIEPVEPTVGMTAAEMWDQISATTQETRLGYSFDASGEIVTLRMTRGDYQRLLICLGSTAASALELRSVLELANRINEGNPAWTPYAFEDADPS